jgi:HSP20 family protein
MSPQGKSGPDMSELFERFSFNRGFFTLSRQIWRPATDIVETQDAFVLRLEVAGVPEESIEVTADGDRLIVRGCRREVRRPDAIRYHTLELQYGKFERVFRFPFSLGKKDVTAAYRDGLLEIEVPKKSTVGPVLIEILEMP